LIPSCAEGGVLGVVPGLVGTIQAAEALKLLLGLGETLVGKLLTIDVMTMAFRKIEIRRDPECPACGTRTLTELLDYDEFCGGREARESAGTAVGEIQPSQLAARLGGGEKLEIIDVREPYEWQIGHIPGARLVPLARLAAEIPRLDKRRETILYCKVGERSMYAAQQLADAGVAQVRNLAGGILRWIDEVDPTMTRY
jgi:adenylyltransferase/sulfurtransferase